MALLRRRHHYPLRLIPAISVVSAAILLLFVFLSFLAPSPVDNDHIHRPRISNDVGEDKAAPKLRVLNSGAVHLRDLWSTKDAGFYYGCSNASIKYAKAAAITQPNRYLAIATSGGLNQQRTGITDAVVAARILNATLVVPKLDQKSFWKDASNFSEIFDVDWFISYLEKDVKIIKELPRRRGQIWNPYTMRVPRKCNEQCYINRLIPVLGKKHAVQLTKFDYRLSNRLGTDLQKLRCRVNYHALKFTRPILEMGAKLDVIMVEVTKRGRELAKIRRRWKTLHNHNPERERRQGRCPLTPEEVGLLLRALGYDRETHIYVASGEVYGGEATLAPLKALFPNFYSKDTLASQDELGPFSSFSSRMAALDFMEIFWHKPTIRPNAKKLYKLFLSRDNMTWEEFASSVRMFQRGFMGEPKEVRPGRGGFHENPAACICEDSEAKRKMDLVRKEHGKGSIPIKRDMDVAVEDQNMNDELEWSDPEDEDDLTSQRESWRNK
ncbi:UNVERIFIED_CONTAM: O-fucosyltransferase 16 [Sesamum radiatum]|uniref:O-fucosyltransferase family protein n=1 Tax=Sesamum radiatum TaxID=300843 RepID=A0AAW2PY15_SESRA